MFTCLFIDAVACNACVQDMAYHNQSKCQEAKERARLLKGMYMYIHTRIISSGLLKFDALSGMLDLLINMCDV